MTNVVSQDVIDLIKHFEGCALVAYQCTGGKWTLGWGHTKNVMKGDTCTQAQADAWLAEDLAKSAAQVNELVEVPLSDWQYGALVSFTFNLGAGALRRSTLRRLLNQGFYDMIPEQMALWVRSGGKITSGLVRRRAAEARMWQGKPWRAKKR